jgi:uncharacterized membrane protein
MLLSLHKTFPVGGFLKMAVDTFARCLTVTGAQVSGISIHRCMPVVYLRKYGSDILFITAVMKYAFGRLDVLWNIIIASSITAL